MDAPRHGSLAARLAIGIALGALAGFGIFVWSGALGERTAVVGDSDAGSSGTASESGHPAPVEDETASPSPRASDDAGQDATPDAEEPVANSPGIEMAPTPDPSPRPPGAVGPLPTLPAVDVPPAPEEPATTVGAIVAGFPSTLIPMAATSTVLSSSVTADGGWIQASVEATDPGSVTEVLDRYIAAFRELGFTWSAADAASGSTAASFSRDGHTVVVSARPQAEGSLFTIVGILREEG